jgi:hypothetical protein
VGGGMGDLEVERKCRRVSLQTQISSRICSFAQWSMGTFCSKKN